MCYLSFVRQHILSLSFCKMVVDDKTRNIISLLSLIPT